MCAFVHGFQPYFYIEKPSIIEGLEDLDDLKAALIVSVCAAAVVGGGGARVCSIIGRSL